MTGDAGQGNFSEIDWDKEWGDFFEELDLSEIDSSNESNDEFKFVLKQPTYNCSKHSRAKRLQVIEAMAEPFGSPARLIASEFLLSCPTCRFIVDKMFEGFQQSTVKQQSLDEDLPYSQD